MRTCMAPSNANLFMGKFESEFLRTQTVLPLVWWRFIDDMFAIWTQGKPTLLEFLRELHLHHTSIKFTMNWSTEKLTFSNIRVYFKNNHLETDLCTKPTDKHQYLHIERCHSWHCKTAILYSQAFRLRIICSESENLQLLSQELKQHCLKWGYPEQLLNSKIERTLKTSQVGSLLCSDWLKMENTSLVVIYHPILPSLTRTIGCHHVTFQG